MTASPLSGLLVVDASRMLPGAVLARCLLDLGARLVKVEAPGIGDPMRRVPPLVDGIGAGFAEHYRGAESVTADLRSDEGRALVAGLAKVADVFVESFRPGTLDGWGLGLRSLRATNPALVTCSLPAAPAGAPRDAEVGHDLNAMARSGLLGRLGSGDGLPRALVADVTTGLLAAQGILAALTTRLRTGKGCHLEQPIAAGPLPFLWWPRADLAAHGETSATDTLLAGRVAAYRTYTCADGAKLAVGCLEPKFWVSFCAAVGRPDLAPGGLDTGPRGEATAKAMAEHLAGRPRSHWLAHLASKALPVCAVHESLNAAAQDPLYASPPLAGGDDGAVGPAVPSLGTRPRRPAPALGAHTEAVRRELAAGELRGWFGPQVPLTEPKR